MAPGKVIATVDGIDFGERTVQSVLRAIDEAPQLDTLGDISLLGEESFLDKLDLTNLPDLPDILDWPTPTIDANTRRSSRRNNHNRIDKLATTTTTTNTTNNNNNEIRPVERSTSLPTDEAQLWQELMLEQKQHYEQQIKILKKQLVETQRQVQQVTPSGPLIERQRWGRVQKILYQYFEQYNLRI